MTHGVLEAWGVFGKIKGFLKKDNRGYRNVHQEIPLFNGRHS